MNSNTEEQMRSRKEIEEEIKNSACDLAWEIELLLDIRELLINGNKK